MIKTCLRILELENLKDHEQIHRAYRRQVKRWHPDQFRHQPAAIHSLAEERLKRINYAYSTLLKYILKNPSILEKHTSEKSLQTEKDQKNKHFNLGKLFKWKQWLKLIKTITSPKDNRTDTTKVFKANKKNNSPDNTFGFKQILRNTTNNSPGYFRQQRNNTHLFSTRRNHKRPNKSTRVEGFTSPSHIPYVTPVRKINKIKSADD